VRGDSRRGVNLILCATTRGEDGTVAFIADDEASAETALADAGIGYQRRPALTIRMENQPGAGAVTFRKLADLLVPVRVSDDLFFAVICVDDPGKARRALGGQGPVLAHGAAAAARVRRRLSRVRRGGRQLASWLARLDDKEQRDPPRPVTGPCGFSIFGYGSFRLQHLGQELPGPLVLWVGDHLPGFP